jgi:hypothetical protein
MHQVYGDRRYVRLQHLSSSHLYNLRRSAEYRSRHTVRTKTRSDPRSAAIAVRRAPMPENQLGFIRIDSVHQVAQFPFKILGFHSDGGTEYINYEVANMHEKARIDFTRSRPRQCNDNALAESKNGNVVRRQFGCSHVPAECAILFNDFCKAHLNPFLNFHRPCLFGTEAADLKKPGRLRRIHRHEDVMPPLEKPASLPGAGNFLREGITLEGLHTLALSQTDVEAARQVREAREAMFNQGCRRNTTALWRCLELRREPRCLIPSVAHN